MQRMISSLELHALKKIRGLWKIEKTWMVVEKYQTNVRIVIFEELLNSKFFWIFLQLPFNYLFYHVKGWSKIS